MGQEQDRAAMLGAEQEVVAAAERLAEWVRLNHPYSVRQEEQDVIDAVDRLEDARGVVAGGGKKAKAKKVITQRTRGPEGEKAKEIYDDME
jgi:hypothetical protein